MMIPQPVRTISVATNKEVVMDIQVTDPAAFADAVAVFMLIDDRTNITYQLMDELFPYLTEDEKEFMLTGITPREFFELSLIEGF